MKNGKIKIGIIALIFHLSSTIVAANIPNILP